MQRVSNNGRQAQNKPQYTFLNMKECIGKNGNQYHGITLEAKVINPGELTTTQSGKSVISFKTPITGRTQYLEKVLGIKVPEKDGTAWAKVSCWYRTAERLDKFFNAVENCSLIVTGSIKGSVSQDGKYTNIDITADDWTVLRTWKSGQQPSAQGQAQQAAPAQASATVPPVEMPEAETEVYYDPAPAEDAFPDGFVPVDTENLEEDLPF